MAFCLCSGPAWSVHINPNGTGEVVLIPYYTVNNGLNTLVTVTNTTDSSKSLKINIREGLNGHAVLSYNVYLGALDSWAFVLTPATSTFAAYVNQPTAKQYTADRSCAPFLVKNGQEFLPYELTDGPAGLERAREGFIEILEMGVLQGEFIEMTDQMIGHGGPDCAGFESAWQSGGVWDLDSGGNASQDLSHPAGGLMAEAYVINVGAGINYDIPVLALADFYEPGSVVHVHPADTDLSMEAAAPNALVMTGQSARHLEFESGVDAVTAVLMAEQLIGNYALDLLVAGQTETIFSQPTRRFYVAKQGDNNRPPYNAMNAPRLLCPTAENSNDLSHYGGTEVRWLIADRESQHQVTSVVFDPPPPRYLPAVCDSVSVWRFMLPGQAVTNPGITGSLHPQLIEAPVVAITANGFIKINFLDTRPLVAVDMVSNQPVELMGLPIIGFTLQQFSNSGVVSGLLAQYGASQKMKSVVRLRDSLQSP